VDILVIHVLVVMNRKEFFLSLENLFLGNWGKRELSRSSSAAAGPVFIQSDLDNNDGETAVSNLFDENSMNNLLLEQIRLVNS
jgi:hypothetical protein